MHIVFEKDDTVFIDDINDGYFVIAYHPENVPLIMVMIDKDECFFASADFINQRGIEDDMATHSSPKDLIEYYRNKGYKFWATKKNHHFYAQMIKIYNGDDSYPS